MEEIAKTITAGGDASEPPEKQSANTDSDYLRATLIWPNHGQVAGEMVRLATYSAKRTRSAKHRESLWADVLAMDDDALRNYLTRVVEQDWALDVYEMIDVAYDWEGVPLWLIVEMLRHRQVWRDFSLEQLSLRAINGLRLPCFTGDDDLDAISERYIEDIAAKFREYAANDRKRPEDLREYLTQGVLTNCVIKSNARAWHHFFWMRCSKEMGGRGGAHPKFEILADSMLAQARDVFPFVFDKILPSGPDGQRESRPDDASENEKSEIVATTFDLAHSAVLDFLRNYGHDGTARLVEEHFREWTANRLSGLPRDD